MLRGERPSVDGRWYHAENAINSPPRPRRSPIMIGGGGERKTLRHGGPVRRRVNIICDPADIPRKLDALDQRCAEAERDRATLETTSLVFGMVDENGDNARRMQRDYLRKLGADPDTMSEEQFRAATGRHFVGTPDDVAADLQRRILDPGVDGVIMNLVLNGHQPGVVTMVGEMLHKLLP